jgi:cation:H+ antiporter
VILSVGSIIDEIALVTVATLEKHGSISLGAILGSNSVIIVAFVVLILIYHKRRQSKRFTAATAYVILIGLVLLASAYIFHSLFWIGSVILILIFVAFFFTDSSRTENGEERELNGTFSLPLFILSLLSIGISSFVIVEIVQDIANIFSISDMLSSIIIAGIAGSLPEIYLMKLSFDQGKDKIASSILNSSTVYKTAVLLSLSALIVPVVEGGNEIAAIILFLILAIIQLIITRL